LVKHKPDLAKVLDTIPETRIAPSPIHGYGLFSRGQIPAGRLLAELDGQKVPWSLQRDFELCEEWNALSPDWLLVRPYKTKYGFINHSRQPNARLELQPSGDRLRLYAATSIAEGEEITLDYRREPLPEDYLRRHGNSYL